MPKAPIYKVPFETFVNIFDNLDNNLDALHFSQTSKYLARFLNDTIIQHLIGINLECKLVEKTVRKKAKKTQKGEYYCNLPFQSNEKLVYVKERDIGKYQCENCYLLKKCGMILGWHVTMSN
ncbi:hypothetical protein C2G38_2231095 [Gigaspora rosea]|uniref:F-box domain-containing protein n=1 Tax=Gigaspora rosea TaxID=44941 RepID=A0A397U1S1_9GLOM|nr:hypothetical protein C2G38_2231095 [Gigaspora rosea]